MAQGSSGAAAIRVLLDELHAELLAAPPELDEPKTLVDIMWNLERLGLRNLSASARGAAAAALDATSLDQLEVLLEVDAGGHAADGKWSVHEVQQSLADEAGAEHLNTLRDTAAAAVTTERSLTYLVQLLRDPAYELVGHGLPFAGNCVSSAPRYGASRAPRQRAGRAMRCQQMWHGFLTYLLWGRT
jgi:hypothetical protein